MHCDAPSGRHLEEADVRAQRRHHWVRGVEHQAQRGRRVGIAGSHAAAPGAHVRRALPAQAAADDADVDGCLQ